MIPSWRSFLSSQSTGNVNRRRLADNIVPEAIIDLTGDDDEEEAAVPPESPFCYKCPICIDDLLCPIATNCGHVFCSDCLSSCLNIRYSCPLCNTDITNLQRLYM
ncbi:hypothetical protein KR059_005636 [Drosophila kikkawai]|nr:hypothetical protein KR059_005636 [Drosophila kikkawai]